ncbi:tyrosine-protein phosphatase non-receptor type 22 isoform X3 [Eleginops maclovinus]|uniref:tyrosine-protein phosphatase non-receptor type 22 isoform X3 n=1 Tax=Eleginops maclovinus TaxID=56733 RepID=UPI003080EA5F
MEQQARIVRSFLAQKQEAGDGFTGEFARLKSQSMRYRSDRTFPTKTAEKQENSKKNRYKDIVPFDYTRVKLTITTSKNDSEYINASFIKGASGSRAYIATQGPLPHTLLDFLRMLWEYNIKVVVMACREFEMGKKKCERYWPEQQEQVFVCEPFTVHCDSEEIKGDYLTRTLRLTHRNCSRTVKQLQYFNWPDHGVPDSVPPILDMLQEMRSYQAHDEVPFCIHCSAGCGRTGVLCVIDYTWSLLKKQMIPADFNIFDIVQSMRTQRPSVVQTKEQYELVYRTIRLLFERFLQAQEEQTCREVAGVPSSAPPDTESSLSELSDEEELRHQYQLLLQEEEAELSHCSRWPPAAQNHITQTVLQEGPWSHVEEGVDDVLSLNPPPSPAVSAAICLMVEDPYFDSPSLEEPPQEEAKWTASPVFSPPALHLNDQELNLPAADPAAADRDEEEAPPLPQRTPESFVTAVDPAPSPPSERLMVIIPPNAAAEALRELGGNPPSPVPPLPERTPESFELALDEAAVLQRSEFTRSRIGTSSEWSSSSSSPHTESRPWIRSKTMKAKMTFSAVPVTLPELTSSPNLQPPSPTPPTLPTVEESLTPPLPVRTPESFILPIEFPVPPPLQKPSRTPPQFGRSSEWDGTAQPKRFLDVVMSRSKSVRAKSSRQEPPTVLQQPTPPTAAAATGSAAEAAGGQSDIQRRPSLKTETPGNKSEKKEEKGMTRSRSLKFFRHKQKPKTAPPPPPSQPEAPAANGASALGFKLGFGYRFGKPKGPRSHPETWV